MTKVAKRSPPSFFSQNLSAELRSILDNEFGQDIQDSARLQEIGIRLVEFVALKERSKAEN